MRTHSKPGYYSLWNILNGPEKFIIDLEGLYQVILTFTQERSTLSSLRKIYPLLVTGNIPEMPPLVIYCFDFHLKDLSWRTDGAYAVSYGSLQDCWCLVTGSPKSFCQNQKPNFCCWQSGTLGTLSNPSDGNDYLKLFLLNALLDSIKVSNP